jgi:signal peptidase I
MPNYCSPTNDRFGTAHPPLMICSNFHVNEAADISKTAHRGDRFLVAKFLTPRRWDIVIFQFPEDPAILYVKRLIGLPGEKIHIQDGSLWVDDERQTPPDALQGIEYLSELPIVGPILSGSVNRPALLGNEEYFVLGDFSSQSSDSRLWERGAPGYNQYAVPKSYIKGVVTHTFWPLDRWRIHR